MTSIEGTRRIVETYLHRHDVSITSDDSEFVVMSTGQESR